MVACCCLLMVVSPVPASAADPVIVPDAPRSITQVLANDGSVAVSWLPAPNEVAAKVAGYVVQREYSWGSSLEKAEQSLPLDARTFTVPSSALCAANGCKIVVLARSSTQVDGKDVTSAPTNGQVAVLGAAPGQPTSVTASRTNLGTVVVRWVAPTNLGLPASVVYDVAITSATGRGSGAQTASVTATVPIDECMATACSVRVTARNAAGRSVPSAVGTWTSVLPAAPVIVSATSAGDTLDIAWQPAADPSSVVGAVLAFDNGGITTQFIDVYPNPDGTTPATFHLDHVGCATACNVAVAFRTTGGTTSFSPMTPVVATPGRASDVRATVAVDGTLTVTWQSNASAATDSAIVIRTLNHQIQLDAHRRTTRIVPPVELQSWQLSCQVGACSVKVLPGDPAANEGWVPVTADTAIPTPAQPTQLTANWQPDGTIAIKWSAGATAPAGLRSSIEVVGRSDGRSAPRFTWTTLAAVATDSTQGSLPAADASKYCATSVCMMRVRTFAGALASPPSPWLAVPPVPSAAPQDVRLQTTNGVSSLQWTRPTATGSALLSHWLVDEVTTAVGGATVDTGVSGLATTSAVPCTGCLVRVTPLTGGTVASGFIDSTGRLPGEPSPWISVGVVPPGPLPGAVDTVEMKAKTTGLAVSWTAPTSGGAVTTYLIERRVSGRWATYGFTLDNSYPIAADEWCLTVADCAFRVTAINLNGPGPTVQAGVSALPTDVTPVVTRADVIVSTSGRPTLELRWANPPAALGRVLAYDLEVERGGRWSVVASLTPRAAAASLDVPPCIANGCRARLIAAGSNGLRGESAPLALLGDVGATLPPGPLALAGYWATYQALNYREVSFTEPAFDRSREQIAGYVVECHASDGWRVVAYSDREFRPSAFEPPSPFHKAYVGSGRVCGAADSLDVRVRSMGATGISAPNGSVTIRSTPFTLSIAARGPDANGQVLLTTDELVAIDVPTPGGFQVQGRVPGGAWRLASRPLSNVNTASTSRQIAAACPDFAPTCELRVVVFSNAAVTPVSNTVTVGNVKPLAPDAVKFTPQDTPNLFELTTLVGASGPTVNGFRIERRQTDVRFTGGKIGEWTVVAVTLPTDTLGRSLWCPFGYLGTTCEFRLVPFNNYGDSDAVAIVLPPTSAGQPRKLAELLGIRSADKGVADPVSVVTGNLRDGYVDLSAPRDGWGLTWGRTYNSRTNAIGVLGLGWSTMLDVSLTGQPGGSVDFRDHDGRTITFVPSATGFGTVEEVDGSLVRTATGYELRWKRGETWVFDNAGRLLSLTGGGRTLTLARDTAARVTSMKSSDGSLTFAYGSDGRVRLATSSDGRSVTYGYTNGYLSSVTDPLARTTSLTTDTSGRLTRLIGPDGVVIFENTFDDLRRVTRQISAGGAPVRFTYDDLARRTTVRDEGTGRDSVFTFDAGGRILSSTDPAGKTTTNQYDKNGNLVASANRATGLVRQTFDDAANLTSIVDALGQRTRFEYDTSNRLIVRTDALARLTRYEYVGTDRIPSKTTYADGSVETQIIANNLVTKKTDADGIAVSYTYDAFGLRTAITDALGSQTTYTYDTSGRVLTARSPVGALTSYAYDRLGRMTSMTDPVGAVTTYTYDAGGRVTKATDPTGAAIVTGYDGGGHRTSVTDASGATSRFTYDVAGRLATVIDPMGAATTYAYNDLNRVSRVTSPLGSATAYDVDADGKLVATTDAAGGVWRIEYDKADRPITSIDPEGRVTTRSYDLLGRVTSEWTPASRANFAYDERDRIVRREVDGVVTTYTYTKAGRLRTERTADGLTLTYSYDGAGRMLTVTGSDGAAESYVYDRDARVVSTTDPTGARTTVTYDMAGQVLTVTDPAGVKTTNTWSKRGELLTSAITGQGTVTRRYDAAGRLATVVDALGGTTTFAYDAAGRLTSRTDALGGIERWKYDAEGRALEHRDQLSRAWTMAYDALGRGVRSTDPTGVAISTAYDRTGLVTARTAPGETVRYSYDTAGRRTAMTDSSGTQKWGYDESLNRVRAHQVGVAVASFYEYNSAGRMSRMTRPDGTPLAFSYDLRGRLMITSAATATSAGMPLVTLGRDVAGRVVSEKAGTSTRSWTFVAGRVTKYTAPAASGSGSVAVNVSYDSSGRVAATGATAYKYDKAGQLVQSGATTYRYDALGRRVAVVAAGKTATSVYDAAGQLASSDGVTFGYDPAGRMTRWGATAMAYDGFGRMVSSVSPAAGAVPASGLERRFDGDGVLRSAVQTAGTARVESLMNPDVVSGVVTGWSSPAGSVDMVDGGAGVAVGRTGSSTAPGAWAPVNRDVFGSVTAGPGSSGVGTYDAYGVGTGSTGLGIGYRGGIVTGGVTRFGVRDYVPSLGVFLTRDPLDGVAGTVTIGNPYHYAGNDPIGRSDPTGMSSVGDNLFRAPVHQIVSGEHTLESGDYVFIDGHWVDRTAYYDYALQRNRTDAAHWEAEQTKWNAGGYWLYVNGWNPMFHFLENGDRCATGNTDIVGEGTSRKSACIQAALNLADAATIGGGLAKIGQATASAITKRAATTIVEDTVVVTADTAATEIEIAVERGASNVAAKAGLPALPRSSLPSAREAANLVRGANPIGSALKSDAAHRAASFVVEDIASNGSVYRIVSGDGLERMLIQTPGELNGIAGRFEWIVDDAGNLTHQMFVKGGSINGLPIKP
jgi:RHS repeat-associated protein